MIVAELSTGPDGGEKWLPALEQAAREAAMPLDLRPAGAAPAEADYVIFSPAGALRDFTAYARAKALFSLWAGVDKSLRFPPPPHNPPLCRMADTGLAEGMRDYVVAHVMRHHVDLDRMLRGVGESWYGGAPPLARNRCVGVLGLGALGATCAQALAGLGFRVLGWSRSPKRLDGVECRTGEDGLDVVLKTSDILVLQLPDTPETDKLIDAARLARMKPGAVLINPARGALIDDDALLDALDSGQLAHATLDVFRREPLPRDHPFRTHARITVTPHIAAVTRPETGAALIIAQIARIERELPPMHVVDRARGY